MLKKLFYLAYFHFESIYERGLLYYKDKNDPRVGKYYMLELNGTVFVSCAFIGLVAHLFTGGSMSFVVTTFVLFFGLKILGFLGFSL